MAAPVGSFPSSGLVLPRDIPAATSHAERLPRSGPPHVLVLLLLILWLRRTKVYDRPGLLRSHSSSCRRFLALRSKQARKQRRLFA